MTLSAYTESPYERPERPFATHLLGAIERLRDAEAAHEAARNELNQAHERFTDARETLAWARSSVAVAWANIEDSMAETKSTWIQPDAVEDTPTT